MDFLPPASVRASLRPAQLVLAILLAGTVGLCASFGGNGTAMVALWGALLALGWVAAATLLTHVCGVEDLAARAPQNTADFHALRGFRVKVQLGNRRRNRPVLFVTARLETVVEGVALHSPPIFIPRLAPLAQLAFAWDITVRKRGQVELRGMRIEAYFPGSLTLSAAHFGFGQRLLALPAIYRLDGRALELVTGRRRSGGRTSSAPASLEDFVGVREYRPGDNPRSIHLALSLRLPEFPDQLAVREYEDPAAEDVLVVLDTAVAAPDDTLQRYRHEKSLSFAAALCRLLAEKQYSVRFRALDGLGGTIDVQVRKPGRDLAQLESHLARIRPTRDATKVAGLLNGPRARRGDAVIFLSLAEESKRVCDGHALLAVGPELQASLVGEVVGA